MMIQWTEKTYSFASSLVTSSMSKAAMVTFLVAFLGSGFIPIPVKK